MCRSSTVAKFSGETGVIQISFCFQGCVSTIFENQNAPYPPRKMAKQPQRELFLSEANNSETIAAIDVNNDMYCLQK